MSVDHYENFPVASILLPRRYRRPVEAIYRVLRLMDDIADEGDLPADERRSALDRCREFIAQIDRNETPDHPAFARLAPVMTEFRLSAGLFWDMIDAFQQDTRQNRYKTWADLLDYCRRSANPVGRMLLTLFGVQSPMATVESDFICTALQLVNFWQDVGVDWREKDRCYIPIETLDAFGLSVEVAGLPDIQRTVWARMMKRLVVDVKDRLLAGSPIAHRLPGRIGFEMRLIVLSGWRIAEKIEEIGLDTRVRRPVLTFRDWAIVFARAVAYRRTIAKFRAQSEPPPAEG